MLYGKYLKQMRITKKGVFESFSFGGISHGLKLAMWHFFLLLPPEAWNYKMGTTVPCLYGTGD